MPHDFNFLDLNKIYDQGSPTETKLLSSRKISGSKKKFSVVAYACHPSIQQAEARGLLQL